MNLEFSDEQRMLGDMVGRFVADSYPFEARQKVLKAGQCWTRENWAAMAGLGLLMTCVPQARGGMATGGVEAMMVGEAFGRGLVLEPWLAAVVAAGLLGHCGHPLADAGLASLMTGEELFTGHAGSELTLADNGLSGTLGFLPAGVSAGQLVLGAKDPSGGSHVVLVDNGAPGITASAYVLAGYGEGAHAVFDGAPVLAVLASGGQAEAAIGAARAAGIAAIAADALGSAQAAFDMTVEYLKTRVQNDRPIGSNQALQHRAAEMFVELEQLRSAALYAACMTDAPDPAERDKAMAAVRIVTAKAARFIAQQAVQLHGGIGVTDEHAIGHHFKRLTADSMLFGDADANAGQLAELGGFVGSLPYWDAPR